jgi:hypothetical protein
MTIDQIIDLLRQAVADRKRLPEIVGEFQAKIWHDEVSGPVEHIEILRDLAYDLDYVEADPAARLEDPSFKDLDYAEDEIRKALSRIRSS